jgi:hypothetical protein
VACRLPSARVLPPAEGNAPTPDAALKWLDRSFEEFLFDVERPSIFTGIDELARRGDFIDRSVIPHLPRIPDTSRRPRGLPSRRRFARPP